VVDALGGDRDQVTSPSYTLVHNYDTQPPVWHVDAWRLQGDDAVEELGLDELAADGLTFIEWAERAPSLAERPGAWHILLEHDPTTGERQARLTVPPGSAFSL
jgi:tRNA threonylcarbamoyladenosine biosynthesis protein TsaE